MDTWSGGVGWVLCQVGWSGYFVRWDEMDTWSGGVGRDGYFVRWGGLGTLSGGVEQCLDLRVFR